MKPAGPTPGAAAAMLLATLLFALMAMAIRFASADYGVGEIVLYRSLVTALLAALACRHQAVGLQTPHARLHALHAAVGALTLGLYFHSITQVPVATAVTLNYASSIWLTLLVAAGVSVQQRGRPIGAATLGAVAVGFVGVVLVLRPTLDSGQWPGAAMGALSGLLAALMYLLVGRLSGAGEPTCRVVFYAAVGAALAGAGLAAAQGWHAHAPLGVAWLAAVAMLGAGGQALLTRAYARGDPVVAASLQYAGVGYALVIGAVVLGEPITAVGLAGIAVIVVAAMACIRLRRRLDAGTP